MTLISRQVNIATTLLNNPQIYKVKDLSQKYGVSTRTLRNDLNKIARWVNTQPGCHLLFSRTVRNASKITIFKPLLSSLLKLAELVHGI